MKNGRAERAPVTIPTSSSAGRATTRPSTSPASSRTAPEHDAVGHDPAVVGPDQRRGRRAGRRGRRTRSGPAAATAPPASSTKPALAAAARRPTRWPSERATSSPSASALSDRPDASAIASPSAMNGQDRQRHARVAAGDRARRSRSGTRRASGRRSTSTALVSETSSVASTAPGEREPQRRRPAAARGCRARAAAPRPRRPRRARSPRRPRPRTRRAARSRSTTANAAPALMPRIPGSASGLRVTPCISAPAPPSAAPTSSPSSVRGTRRSRTIACASLPSLPVSARHDLGERHAARADRQRGRRAQQHQPAAAGQAGAPPGGRGEERMGCGVGARGY